MGFLLALDQGTTSCRTIVFNENAQVVSSSQEELRQIFPKPGWVEHDPEEIWNTQLSTIIHAVNHSGISAREIEGLGITNQRETAILWNRKTGKPLMNAIVWQDKRTSQLCDEWVDKGWGKRIQEKTGLVIDSYFSASKLYWMLKNIPGALEQAIKGDLCFGTVDSWLIYKMTNGDKHVTDVTNASRTMFFNINEMAWDNDLLNLFDIPSEILPEVKDCVDDFGHFHWNDHKIPITGVAGDQQAALLGQACLTKGTAKNTYGTGCFLLMNTGAQVIRSKHKLLSTVAWKIGETTNYALEGSIFIAGAALQWLRDGLKIIQHVKDSEDMAKALGDNDHVYLVPAFSGLGSPYWDMKARGAIFGLTRDTTEKHLCRAALEAIAYQTKDIFGIMEKDSGIQLKVLKVDGGAAANDFLLQYQADILHVPVSRPQNVESTALGAALLAGIATGFWKISDLPDLVEEDRVFEPLMSPEKSDNYYRGWLNAVKRTLNWMED